MAKCRRNMTPVLMHWNYISFALSHRYDIYMETDNRWLSTKLNKLQYASNGVLSLLHYAIGEMFAWKVIIDGLA